MLSSRVTPFHPSGNHPALDENDYGNSHEDEDEVDLFSCFLPHLFPDEAPPCLGEPGQTLLYSSALFGDLRLMIPDYSAERQEDISAELAVKETRGRDAEASRQLFAHYLWGAALVVAEGIEDAARLEAYNYKYGHENEHKSAMRWSVKGHRVLEVGAGVALPSLISTLAGAQHVAVTDHPSSTALYGPIQFNLSQNIPIPNKKQEKQLVSIHPHEWGVFDPLDPFTAANKGKFTRIICADCLWMGDQHVNLIKTILWFLSPTQTPIHGQGSGCKDGVGNGNGSGNGGGDGGDGVCWVVAGFHTGRNTVASFFETAVSMGLAIDEIWERDVHSTTTTGQGKGKGEVTRPWKPVRGDEGPENRSRWCVVAILSVKT